MRAYTDINNLCILLLKVKYSLCALPFFFFIFRNVQELIHAKTLQQFLYSKKIYINSIQFSLSPSTRHIDIPLILSSLHSKALLKLKNKQNKNFNFRKRNKSEMKKKKI